MSISLKEVPMWVCDKCGKIYSSKSFAEICCKEYSCDMCGKALPKYQTRCEECADKFWFEKAEKLSWDEYQKKCPGYPIVWKDEIYYDIWDLWDDSNFQIEQPEWVWGTCMDKMTVDIEPAIEEAEEACSDGGFDEWSRQELIDFVNDWNERNGIELYFKDKDVAVYIPKDDRWGEE